VVCTLEVLGCNVEVPRLCLEEIAGQVAEVCLVEPQAQALDVVAVVAP